MNDTDLLQAQLSEFASSVQKATAAQLVRIMVTKTVEGTERYSANGISATTKDYPNPEDLFTELVYESLAFAQSVLNQNGSPLKIAIIGSDGKVQLVGDTQVNTFTMRETSG